MNPEQDQSDLPVVLIVDDHVVNRQILCFALSKYARIIEAENGEQALKRIADHEPDVMFLDLMMPKTSGLDVLSALAVQNSPLLGCTMVVTSRADDAIRDDVLAMGVYDFKTKPISLNEMLDAFRMMTNAADRANAPAA